MNVAVKILYGIIIFQIALGPAFLSGPSAYAGASSSASAAQQLKSGHGIFSNAAFSGANLSRPTPSDVTLAQAGDALELDPALELQVENQLSAFSRAGEEELPGASEDVFHLTQQFLEIYEKDQKVEKSSKFFDTRDRKVALRKNTMFMALPEVSYGNFENEITIELNAAQKNISFVLSDDTGPLAKQVITGFEPISYARDKELIMFLDASGKVYAIDAGYARNRTFTGPLPVFEVADIKTKFTGSEKITSHFVTRGLKPFESYIQAADGMFPLDKPLTPEYTAGDLVIYSGASSTSGASENGRGEPRKMLAMLDRNVMQSIMYRNEVFILKLAQPFISTSEASSRINFSSQKVIDRLSALIQAESGKPHGTYDSADPLTRKVFASIALNSIQPLMMAAETNQAVQGRLRDRFTSQEGWESFKTIHDEGVIERQEQASSEQKNERLLTLALNQTLNASGQDNSLRNTDTDYEADALTLEQKAQERATTAPLEKGIKGFLHRAITPKSLKILGAITAVGAAAVGIYLGGHALLAGHGAYWAVHLFQGLYNHLWPAVLKDQVYRVTALQTAFWMSWSVPLLWGIGALTAKIKGQNWSAQKGLAVLTWRVLAVLQYSFLKRLAKLTRQEQFIAALKHNVNPFKRIKADSLVGRQADLKRDITIGINNPFLSKKEMALITDERARALDAISYQTSRGRALAWFLALMTTADRQKLDPVTLAILAQNPKANAEQMERFTGDAGFRQKWIEVAQEYEGVLKDFASTGVTEDVKTMSAQELKQFRVSVEETAKKISSRGKLAQLAMSLKNEWNHFGDKAMPFLGNYGEVENKILSKGVPDKFTETYWNGFWTDFYFTLAQDIVVGARANPADLAKVQQALAQGQAWPNTDLAANATKLFKTNPDFVAENAGSTVGGAISSSVLMLNYSTQGSILEEAYAPIEDRTLTTGEKEDGYWSGMGQWFRGSLNIREANYGVLWTKALFKKVATLQSAAIIGVATRMIFGHKTFFNAGMGFFYMFFWANWAGSAIWDWVRAGNKIYQSNMAEKEQVFRQAKTVLNQGLRFNDIEGMGAGYAQLSALYEGSKTEIPEAVRKAMQGAQQFMKAPTEEVGAAIEAVHETQMAQQNLITAMDTGDQTQIDRAKSELRDLYRDEDAAAGAAGAAGRAQLFKMNAKTLLEFSLQSPPFATKVNGGVNTTSNLIGSPLTTYFLSFVSAMTLHSSAGWGVMFLHMMPISIGLYVASYVAQRLLNKYGEGMAESIKQKVAEVKSRFCLTSLDLARPKIN